jgi:RhtB (resistance to homoserine/threonine) family protein
MLSDYLVELAAVMAVFSFAIVAPGADTAVVMRQSLVHGRRAGILTAFGIGASLLFHVTYTILGLGLIVAQSLLLLSIIKWVGAAYLIYLGIMALRAPAMALPDPAAMPSQAVKVGAAKSFALGFITNALNPKAILFFLSLFSVLVSHQTPALVKGAYGLVMATALVAWFSGVAYFMTTLRVRRGFARIGPWLNRLTGAVFIAFGLRLVMAKAE